MGHMLEHSSSPPSGARMMPSLTDLAVRTAAPPEKGTATLWDGSLKGFGLRINHGGKKSWIVLIASGRRQTIGHYPLVSLADARKEARRILAEKELGKVRPRFVAFDDAKATYLAHCQSKNRSLTIRDYTRHLGTHFPFGRKAIGDIQPRDIIRQLAPLPPSEKHHAFTTARAFFRWCVRQHLIDRSPMENMEVPTNGKPRERVLSDTELTCLWKATECPRTAFHAIVRLLMLTGQRRGEIAALRWEWIGEDTLTFPASVTKNKRTHVLPLGEQTARLLSSLPRFEGIPYVFPAARTCSKTTTVFNGWSKPKAKFDKECGVTDWTLHDIRRSVASGLQRLGVRLEVTERLLNHVSGTQAGIVGVYQKYSFIPEMRAAVVQWEQYLSTLREKAHATL